VSLIPLADAAARLGLRPSSARALIRRGLLRATKIGPIWVVEPSEVDRYARERRPPGNPQFGEAVLNLRSGSAEGLAL